MIRSFNLIIKLLILNFIMYLFKNKIDSIIIYKIYLGS